MQKLYVIGGGIILVVVALWFFSSSQSVPEVRNDTIVWLGDSIGAGYGATVGNSPPDYLSRQLNMSVVNLSTSGDTTLDGVEKIDQVLANDPGLVIVQLAGNDALQKIPQSETETHLRTMITSFQANDSVVAVVGIRSGPFGDTYGEMFESLAKEYNVIYVPDALKGLFGRTEYMSDPIHPNDAGSEKLAGRVFEAVGQIYE